MKAKCLLDNLVVGIAMSLSFGCAMEAVTDGAADLDLTDYDVKMKKACLKSLGPSLWTSQQPMTMEEAQQLAKKHWLLGRIRLSVREASCTTKDNDPGESPQCLAKDVPRAALHGPTPKNDDDVNYRAADVYLDLPVPDAKPNLPPLHFERTLKPSVSSAAEAAALGWPIWEVSGTFGALMVRYSEPRLLEDEFGVLPGGSELWIPVRLSNSSLVLEKTPPPRITWNGVQCARISGALQLPQ